MKVLVMGGSRFSGRATVQELLRRGHDVHVFNRGQTAAAAVPGTTSLSGDRNVPADLGQLRDLELDAVVDFSAYTGQQTSLLLEHLPPVRRIVHCSTGALYDPSTPQPWREDAPYGPWPLWGGYAVEKLRCEQVLRASDLAPVVSLRFPYILGPRNYADREEFVLNRLLDDEVVLVPGDGQARLQHISADDAGFAFAQALEVDVDGTFTPYNVAAPGVFTPLELVATCAEVTGRTPRVLHVPAEVEQIDNANLVFPFPNVDYVLDTSRAVADGLVRPGAETLADVVRSAYDALVADPGRRQWSRYAAELAELAA